MIQLSAVHKAFGARVLLDAVTWQVQPGDRVGLCGPNGAGKTTLLRLMAGLEEPDTGRLVRPANLTVGYLPQDGVVHAGRTLFEEAAGAFDELAAIETEMREIEARLAAAPGPDQQQLLSRYSELQDTFLHQGGYDVEARVNAVLRGLGFQEADLGRPTEHFSGGWQMRIALAKLLLRRPRLLLMDEPTNHLDLEARNWLEDFLIGYPYAVVLVSHDRYFLDKVVTSIAEISLRSITTCPGSYSAYLVERDARLAKLRERKRLQDEEIARMQAFIDRFRYQATKAAQVQSRVKMLEKITPIEVPPERKRVHFKFPASARSGRMVLELRGVRKAYGPLEVFRSADVHIERGDRIALVGPNGSGKSTLMRMLSGVEAPDAGERQVGSGVVARYFAQDEAARLDPALNVYETLSAGSPISMVPAIRNILGGFLFEGDDIYKRAGVLSGGERTRLAVARMLLHPSNTLLLDEPTNHSTSIPRTSCSTRSPTTAARSSSCRTIATSWTSWRPRCSTSAAATRTCIPAPTRSSAGAENSNPDGRKRTPARSGRRQGPRRARRAAGPPSRARPGTRPAAWNVGSSPCAHGSPSWSSGSASASSPCAASKPTSRSPTSTVMRRAPGPASTSTRPLCGRSAT